MGLWSWKTKNYLFPPILWTVLFFIGTGFFSFFAGRIFLWAGLRFFTFTRFTGILFIATGFTFPTTGLTIFFTAI